MIDLTFALSSISDFVVQGVIAYVVFVLTSSSLGLWINSSILMCRWKACVVSMTFALAACIIVTSTRVFTWVAVTAVLLAIFGPVVYMWMQGHKNTRPPDRL